jgi:hypothetical protein
MSAAIVAVSCVGGAEENDACAAGLIQSRGQSVGLKGTRGRAVGQWFAGRSGSSSGIGVQLARALKEAAFGV